MKTAEIKVSLIDVMGDDLTVVNAARVSFDKESERQINYELSDKDAKLIRYLAKHNHWSPFAHASVSVRVKAPIFVARQLVKHTVGFSWNEVSRRYVDDEPEFFFPDYWRERAENIKQGSSSKKVELAPIEDMFSDIGSVLLPDEITRHCLETYKAMLDLGVCPEQARMILPQNTMTEWIWTGTLYAWARMCNLRLDSHTQIETMDVAIEIDDIMSELFPVSWEALKE